MKRYLSLMLGLLVVLLVAGHATAAELVIITLDEFGTALVTKDGVTVRPPLGQGRPIAGGGIAFFWEGWGVIGGDIFSGTVLIVDGDGHVSDSIIFENNGPVSFFSDGTDGFDSPADRLPPLPLNKNFGPHDFDRALEIGPEGDNGAFFFVGQLAAIPGGSRQFDVLYRFVSDGRIVPEPASLVLLVSGFVGLAGLAWRRHQRN